MNQIIETKKLEESLTTDVQDVYSYDYITIETNEKFAMEYVDCYEALGFQLAKNERTISFKTALTFKRNRKIQNKDKLKKIQVELNEVLATINRFEQKKTRQPMAAAISLGTAGTLTFGGGLSLALLNSDTTGAIVGGIALGLLGLAISGIGYFVYKRLHAKKVIAMNELIDKKRDEISVLCEEAQKYLKESK